MTQFVLKRKPRTYHQCDCGSPKIRIKPDSYALLVSWAQETGRSIAEIAREAVNFAAEHLVLIDPD